VQRTYVTQTDIATMEKLTELITPSLLTGLVDAIIPYSPTDQIDFSTTPSKLLGGDTRLPPSVGIPAWEFLVALSKLDSSEIPKINLLAFLPRPSEVDFPKQALGMQLLLDQAPRRLCKGADRRWIKGLFDGVSIAFAKSLDSLPEGESPYSWERWERTGTKFGYWVLARTWFVTPFVHSEDFDLQKRAVEFTDQTRKKVEQITGTMDPHRKKRDEILSDFYAFPRVVREGPAKDVTTVEGYAYWMCMVMDVHFPIINRFKRYPYANLWCGRQDTDEELEWMEKTGGFGRVDEQVAERVRKDIEMGVWTPLGLK